MDWIAAKGIDAILEHERDLADRFLSGIAGLDNIEVHGCGESHPTALGPDRLPIISITVAGRPAEEIGLFLDSDWNIAVRTGLQCAPLAHEAMGTAPAGSVRISFGPFNTSTDVDVGVAALKDLAG